MKGWIGIVAAASGCTGEPDVLGSWVATRVDTYGLADGGGVVDLVETPYPVEEAFDPPADDGAIAVVHERRMVFEAERVDELSDTVRVFADRADEVTTETSTWRWEQDGGVAVKLFGDFEAEHYGCNLVAGPDTLVCNLEVPDGDVLNVVSTRYARVDEGKGEPQP